MNPLGLASLIAFASTIPAANYLIGNVGTECLPNGPCLIPVWFGLTAPSGVLMVGAALLLRDLVQHELGTRWAIFAVALGGLASGLCAPLALTEASVAAFMLSEMVDMAVYTPLRQRRLVMAIAASNVAGVFVDSVIFLWLAFDSIDMLSGQVIGKMLMTAAATPIVMLMRRTPTEGGGNG